MSDELYAALGWGAIAAWAASERNPLERASWSWAALSGLLLGWQILTRANGALTLMAIAVVWVAGSRARGTVLRLALVAGLALLPALGWSIRSSRLEGRPVFVHSLFWYNFWMGEAIDRVGVESERGDRAEARQRIIAEASGMPEPADPRFWWGSLSPEKAAQLEENLGRAAWRRLLDDPLHYVARCAKGVVHFWVRGETRARTLQYAGLAAPVLLLMGVGASGAWRREGATGPLGRIALVAVAAHCLAFAMVLPMARLSVQVYPMAACLAGLGAARLMRLRA